MKICVFLLGLYAALLPNLASAVPTALQLTGRGTQIYICRNNSGKYGWTLEGPDATLYDTSGKMVGRHYFGPHWQANDGSTIKGTVLESNASPQGPRNVSWLILSAVVQKGDGIFGRVSFVTRTDTKGGGTPTAACTTAQNGMKKSVPYTAIYTFFSEL